MLCLSGQEVTCLGPMAKVRLRILFFFLLMDFKKQMYNLYHLPHPVNHTVILDFVQSL